MKVKFLTLALDAMPFITRHWPMMQTLNFDWEWWVVEGVADNVNCTKWCETIPPRLSLDGTSQYLDSISRIDPRIHILRQEIWHGKLEMVNAPLKFIYEPEFLLWQIDSDEIWNVFQIATMRKMFIDNPKRNCAYFRCRYFFGKWVATKGFGNREAYEWHRVWKMRDGMRFASHEPPELERFSPNPFRHAETEKAGLVFDHFSYATEAQLEFKQKYYGRESGWYKNAVADWKRLQDAPGKTVRLRDYLPWVKDDTMAERVG